MDVWHSQPNQLENTINDFLILIVLRPICCISFCPDKIIQCTGFGFKKHQINELKNMSFNPALILLYQILKSSPSKWPKGDKRNKLSPALCCKRKGISPVACFCDILKSNKLVDPDVAKCATQLKVGAIAVLFIQQ